MPLHTGKLPAELLARLLSRVVSRDPRVLLGPTVGEDAALIDLGDRVLVAKADPVTFATDRIGWYAVHVNANDVACMGARPAWFLATILLPQGAPEALAEDVFAQIEAACEALDITLVGGHTEVTYGLERPDRRRRHAGGGGRPVASCGRRTPGRETISSSRRASPSRGRPSWRATPPITCGAAASTRRPWSGRALSSIAPASV